MKKLRPPIPVDEANGVNFFDTPGVDLLYRTCLALAEQLAVTQDRLDTLERVLNARGGLAKGELERFEPSPEDEQEKQRLMSQLASDVLSPIEAMVREYEGAHHTSKKGEAP